jgi:hypothetical protein
VRKKQGNRESKSVNAKAQNLSPKKERKSASPKGSVRVRESAKTKKSMPSSGYTNTFIALKSEG